MFIYSLTTKSINKWRFFFNTKFFDFWLIKKNINIFVFLYKLFFHMRNIYACEYTPHLDSTICLFKTLFAF